MLTLDNYEAARDWLYSLKNRGSKYGIDRMLVFAEALGQPQRSYPSIHVAGTNGKGSVSAMLERILRERGWRVGLSTSPHLVRQGERIQVDRRILDEQEIFAYAKELQPIAARVAENDPELHPSFFEFMTAMAFLHFQRQAVDVAVVEVGLGGRLDATNVLQPNLCIITSIGLDHCEILGDTVEKIAFEKVGIIKPGVPVVIGQLPKPAEAVVRSVCSERGCALHSIADRFGADVGHYPATNLQGMYQPINAAVALLAAEILGDRFRFDEASACRALMKVKWPGRWQEHALPGGRRAVFDVTHNAEGAVWLSRNLERLVAQSGGLRPDVVMGVMGASRAASLVPTVASWARSLTFVVPQQERACSWEELEACVPSSFRGELRRSSIAEIFPGEGRCALDGASPNPLVVTGSIYLIGEVWDRFFQKSPLGQGALQDF